MTKTSWILLIVGLMANLGLVIGSPTLAEAAESGEILQVAVTATVPPRAMAPYRAAHASDVILARRVVRLGSPIEVVINLHNAAHPLRHHPVTLRLVDQLHGRLAAITTGVSDEQGQLRIHLPLEQVWPGHFQLQVWDDFFAQPILLDDQPWLTIVPQPAEPPPTQPDELVSDQTTIIVLTSQLGWSGTLPWEMSDRQAEVLPLVGSVLVDHRARPRIRDGPG